MHSIIAIPLLAALASSAACGDASDGDPEPSPPGDDDLISHEPAWVASGAEGDICFGWTGAVGDLDGDGRRDLLVGNPRCDGPAVDQIVIYRGDDALLVPEEEGLRVDIDWQNEDPFPFNVLQIGVGDVDGDELADVLVSSDDGAILYRGNDDLVAMFAEPAFRVPEESANTALLADLNDDDRDDIVAEIDGSAVVFLTGDDDGAPTFTRSRAVEGIPRGTGDVDGDGVDDLLVDSQDGTARLYLGCAGELPACDGGLGPESVWGAAGLVAGSASDLNGDGRGDVVLKDLGRIFVYFSDPAVEFLPESPSWVQHGDPVFIDFGRSLAAPGGVLGSGSEAEFLVGSLARVYLYRMPGGGSGEPRPVWAFPEADVASTDSPIELSYSVAPADDLDADGYQDFVVAGTSGERGMVMLFTGGRLPGDAPEPQIPEPFACGPMTGGLPDLTVDTETIRRTVYISTETFAADACELVESCIGAPGDRRLLRFSVSIVNLGSGTAIVPGPEVTPDLYQYDECHGHDHLIGFSDYRLIGEDGNELRGHKQGFYMTDVASYCAGSAGPVAHDPAQGISAGWSDIYVAAFPCQWIDITGLADGTYELRVSVDGSDVIPEGDEHPNEVALTVEIDGDQVTAPRP